MENIQNFIKFDEIDRIQVGSYYGYPVIMTPNKEIIALEYSSGRAVKIHRENNKFIKILGHIEEPQNNKTITIEWLVDTNHFIILNRKFL